MTIYFYNNQEAPIEALVTMGVSVKSEGSIGYFGTGFKFAVATLLRTGHRIWLNDAEFGSRPSSIRGETFHIVTFDGRDLGFTTQLGRNWEPWMAFRELHSNALDEGGSSSRRKPEGYETVVAVRGDGIEGAFDRRGEIFLDSTPIVATEDIELHTGPSSFAFYRGVRAGAWPEPAAFRYNLLRRANLTEDRTLAGMWAVEHEAANTIASCDDPEVINTAILASDTMECRFSYAISTPSETFLEQVHRHRSNARLNNSALELYKKHRGSSTAEPEPTVLTTSEQRVVEKAMALLAKLDCEPEATYVETLGAGTMGLCRGGRIYIARSTIDKGHRVLASTLYEEWLHQVHGLLDGTRSMQDHLLDRLLALVDGAEQDIPF